MSEEFVQSSEHAHGVCQKHLSVLSVNRMA